VPVLINGPLCFIDVSRLKQVRSEYISAMKDKSHARNDQRELLHHFSLESESCY